MANLSTLRPIRRTKAYNLAAEQIRTLIVVGTWRSGDRIPSEKELADKLAISRGSVREALRILEALGWVEIRPGEGTIVKDRINVQFSASVSETVPPPIVDLGDLWEARKVVEPRAAHLAAERCDESDLASIQEILSQTEALIEQGDWAKALYLNPDFHLSVTRASGNEVLGRMQEELARLERAAVVSEGEPDYTPERAAKVLTAHKAVYDAIRASDPAGAERCMFQHLLDSWMAKWRKP